MTTTISARRARYLGWNAYPKQFPGAMMAKASSTGEVKERAKPGPKPGSRKPLIPAFRWNEAKALQSELNLRLASYPRWLKQKKLTEKQIQNQIEEFTLAIMMAQR